MLQVGQQLWYVPNDSRRGEARFVTVTQVGRKWAQISPTSRISIETLAVDAGRLSSPGPAT